MRTSHLFFKRERRATGAMLSLPYSLGQKAEALYLADRTAEALEAINEPGGRGIRLPL